MLTKEEKAWVKKMQALLDKCPSDRLGFYTIGDCDVTIFNNDHYDDIIDAQDTNNEDFGPAVDRFDAHLGSLNFPSNVESVAG